MNYSNLSDAKSGVGYSRKIRGFNFRNNIKFNKKPNSSKMSEDTYKISICPESKENIEKAKNDG